MNKLVKWLDSIPLKLSRIIRSLIISLTMALIGFGIYLQLQSDIGLAPWNALSKGVSTHVGLSFGITNIIISFIVLAIDLIIKEKIGIGTILDSVLTGVFIDIYTDANVLPVFSGLTIQITVFLLGIVLVSIGQAIYMAMGLSLGTRDALAVGLSRRVKKLSVGIVSNMLFAVVLGISYLLGAPIGIGTVISVFGSGIVLDAVCWVLRFDPRNVKQEDIVTSAKIFLEK